MGIADFVHEMGQVAEFRGVAGEIVCHRSAIGIHGETRVRFRGVKEVGGSVVIVFVVEPLHGRRAVIVRRDAFQIVTDKGKT